MWRRKPPDEEPKPRRHVWAKYRVRRTAYVFFFLAALCAGCAYWEKPSMWSFSIFAPDHILTPKEQAVGECMIGAYACAVIGFICLLIAASMPPHKSR